MWQSRASNYRPHLVQNNQSEPASSLTLNTEALARECDWLERAFQVRLAWFVARNDGANNIADDLNEYLQNPQHGSEPPIPQNLALKRERNIVQDRNITKPGAMSLPPLPAFSEASCSSPYQDFIAEHAPDLLEHCVLILALIPTVKPQLFDAMFNALKHENRPFTELGLVERSGCLYATGATAAFIIDGGKVNTHVQVLHHLQHSPCLRQVLFFPPETNDAAANGGSMNSGPEVSQLSMPLSLKAEYQQRFTLGTPFRPEMSAAFPASRIETSLTWNDLVLPATTQSQLNEIEQWVQHGAKLMQWRIGKQLRPGYRALFYGPPGTGKTLTASVLGNQIGMDVYRIDVSMVMSKYIGDTEKSLELVFSLAEDRNWILFFDEADALFGKRTITHSSNDQFANQNVAYLLQRIEGFNGLVVLATNYKDNLDSAFFRRFESIVHFPAPGAAQRLSMWRNGFCEQTRLGEGVNLAQLAERYPLSGAEIVNVIRFVSLKLLAEDRTDVQPADIQQGIERVNEHKSSPLGW